MPCNNNEMGFNIVCGFCGRRNCVAITHGFDNIGNLSYDVDVVG